MKVFRSSVFAGVLLVAAALSGQEATAGPSVVELFTSQGCSSCPPADAFLGDLAKREDVIALSLSVDYWDFLGWKDTKASPEHSERQRAYARMRGDSQVYTPQMVINGATHVVGSRREEVNAEIERTSAIIAERATEVTITEKAGKLVVDVAGTHVATAGDQEATVWLVLYETAATVDIKRGENRGRSVTYHNVVREMMPIGMWSGAPVSITLPRKDLVQKGYDGCAVLVQLDGTGPIIGAAATKTMLTASN